MKVKITQLCLTLCNPMYYTVHGILQARILEWIAFPFSRGSSKPRDWTQVSCIAGGFFTNWATRTRQPGKASALAHTRNKWVTSSLGPGLRVKITATQITKTKLLGKFRRADPQSSPALCRFPLNPRGILGSDNSSLLRTALCFESLVQHWLLATGTVTPQISPSEEWQLKMLSDSAKCLLGFQVILCWESLIWTSGRKPQNDCCCLVSSVFNSLWPHGL